MLSTVCAVDLQRLEPLRRPIEALATRTQDTRTKLR
jgi:hypothetical protein